MPLEVVRDKIGKVIYLDVYNSPGRCEGGVVDGGRGFKFFIDPLGPYVSIKRLLLQLKDGGGEAAGGVTLDVSRLEKKLKGLVFNMAARYGYRFSKYITRGKTNKGDGVWLRVYDGRDRALEGLVKRDAVVAEVKDLINEPANIATPQYVCSWVLKRFGGMPHTHVEVMDEDRIQKEGLGLVHAVGKGSSKGCRFLVVDYSPPGAKKTVCICGKGVIFDAGGTQAKTGDANSYAMKGDKTGGCIALGIVKYMATEGSRCRLVALVPLVENVVSGTATMPGDIVVSHSGKTVEIIDTDAEGRLILADALSYCNRYKPDYVLDFATLTGWANKLHCDTAAIFFTGSEGLSSLLEEIGEAVGERVWRMPRWLEYMGYCRSRVADLKNHDLTIDGCSHGGGFMAAMFLAHFVPEGCLRDRWIHFDLVNTIDMHTMNANGMVLGIELIRHIVG